MCGQRPVVCFPAVLLPCVISNTYHIDISRPDTLTATEPTGSGGKVNLHAISKKGDTYLRTLLIHGARSVLEHTKEPGEWIGQMKKRRPKNVVVVALANKMARTIWAVLAHDRPYRKDYISVKPA
ncbi:hypothetical protein QFZ91_005306 [Paraburkholderia sp. JPY419]